ncbi:hypothetical protein AB0C32_31915, partial [Streptosporangium sp. NPDC048865]
MDIGVILPSLAVQRNQRLDLGTAARHAEEAGLDGVWHGDHLATGRHGRGQTRRDARGVRRGQHRRLGVGAATGEG